jgi:hypothetical protein
MEILFNVQPTLPSKNKIVPDFSEHKRNIKIQNPCHICLGHIIQGGQKNLSTNVLFQEFYRLLK